MEPPYKGHIGTCWHFVLYIEVVLCLEVQNVLSRYEVLHLGPLNLSFIWRLFLLRPLYEVSIKRDSTVVGDSDDPVTVWKKLGDQFQRKMWANKLELRKQLYSL